MHRIDVEAILKSKSPQTAKKKYIVRLLKRIIHEDEINLFLEQHGHETGMDFVNSSINFAGLRIKVIGRENIPDNGHVQFVANHPLGGLDGLACLKIIGERHPGVRTLSNDILMNLSNLNSLFVPVNKHGIQGREIQKIIDDAYRADTPLMSFPAGLVSRLQKGGIYDLEWKKSFITKSIQHQRDIVPIYISGRNSAFFYILAKIRQLFRIKINIEMLFLPDELFKFKNKEITLIFGPPIKIDSLDKTRSHIQLAQDIKKIVYNLKDAYKR